MIDDALKADVAKWSAFYEHRIKTGAVSQNDLHYKPAPLIITETRIPPRGIRRQVYANHGHVWLRVRGLPPMADCTSYLQGMDL